MRLARRAALTLAVISAASSFARVSLADEPPTPVDPPAPIEEAPPDAPAEPPSPPSPPVEAPKRTPMKPLPPPSALAPQKATRWYGWQTLLVDAVAAGLMIGAVADARDTGDGILSLLAPTRFLKDPPKHTAFIDGSLIFYTLGPAFVHAVHERGVQAALSPPIRLFAPTLGTLTGAVYGFAFAVVVAIADGSDGFRSGSPAQTVLIGSIASGYALGFIAPILIDAVIFGHEPIAPAEDAATKKAAVKPSVKWAPRLGVSKEGPSFSIGGTF
jgi:hypothetical protein